MPTLLHSLQKHDLGHLHIIADGWDLDLQAPDVRQGRKDLVEAILANRARVSELVEDLTAEEQEALADLLGQDGQTAWHLFTQQYGQIREMGPGRRDREQPHHNPISTTERLWYLGLIARDFLDSPAGPVEFAYIPDDLSPLLPAFLRTVPQKTLLSRPATPVERAYPFPVNDHILDHAATLLAALRITDGKFDPALLEVHRQEWPLPPETLAELLLSAGILDDQNVPVSDPTREFLEAPRAEALAQLAATWLYSQEFDDLLLIPHLEADNEFPHNPLEMRQSALDVLRSLPADQWWRLPALISAVRTQQPNFLRPKGDYDTWYLKDVRSNQYLRGIEYWDQVEGEYLRFLVTGPLHWLGMIELAASQPDGQRDAFHFSAWFPQLIAGQPPAFPWREDQSPTLDSQGQILVPRLAPRAARYLIARFCEWGPIKRAQYSYSLTPSSLSRAEAQGLKLKHLLGVLQRYSSSPLPPNTLQALKRWQEHGAQISFQQSVVLKVSRPEILEKLQSSPARRFLGAPLGPTTITVTPGALDKVREILISLGYLSELDSSLKS